MIDPTKENISETMQDNLEKAIIVDTKKGLGSPIETELLESTTPLETKKNDTPSKNPKEPGSPTLCNSNPILV